MSQRKVRQELFPIAVSQRYLAKALGVHPRHVKAMVDAGLPLYQVPNSTAQKVLVLDACEFIRTHWNIVKGRPRNA